MPTVVTKTHLHRLIEAGNVFQASYIIPHGGELANDGILKFAMETGATEIELHWELDVGGDSHFLVYEGATYSGGSAVTTSNKNRSATSNVNLVTVKSGVTSTDGTLFEEEFVAGGSGPNSAGAQDQEGSVWIFKPNTTYRFDLINRSGSAMLGSVTFIFASD